ncbi:hypothetical protein L9F63_019015, partial [Diploptera punctata]
PELAGVTGVLEDSVRSVTGVWRATGPRVNDVVSIMHWTSAAGVYCGSSFDYPSTRTAVNMGSGPLVLADVVFDTFIIRCPRLSKSSCMDDGSLDEWNLTLLQQPIFGESTAARTILRAGPSSPSPQSFLHQLMKRQEARRRPE